MDTLTPKQRSERMSRIRGKDMRPELTVRRITHGMGYRYRLHVRTLPGNPDLVFRPRRKVIFVHGCFWHRHEGCKLARLPKTRLEFWLPKLESNKQRDMAKQAQLHESGWEVLVIWECWLSDTAFVQSEIKDFLQGRHEIN